MTPPTPRPNFLPPHLEKKKKLIGWDTFFPIAPPVFLAMIGGGLHICAGLRGQYLVWGLAVDLRPACVRWVLWSDCVYVQAGFSLHC